MTNPFEEIAVNLRRRVDRLINTTEAKFQYIRDIQGDPIADLDDTRTLTLVVNAHGPVLHELVRTVGALGVVTAKLFTTQDKLLDRLMELEGRAALLEGNVSTVRSDLDGVFDELADLVNEVDKRTLFVPDTPDGL